MDKSKPFGLIIPKKGKTFRPAAAAIFGSDSDEESTSSKMKSKIPQSKKVSKIKSETLIDPSIYEYDAIYDEMKEQKKAEVVPKEQKSSRYIENLLKASDKRKKEYERRVERKVQTEREKEGDEFEDKEMFVTSAYKKKLEEREAEEERERRENQLNDLMDVTKQKDLSGFYRHFLKQSVGEEKIPEIGEKFATIKKEPLSDSDREETHNPTTETTRQNPTTETTRQTNLYPDDKDDSDSVSSRSEDSDKEDRNSYEMSVRQYRKRNKRSSSPEELEGKSSNIELPNAENIKNGTSESNRPKPNKRLKATDEKAESSRNIINKNQNVEDTTEGKNFAQLDADENDEEQSSDVKEEQDFIEDKPKVLKNIFEKRHVGEMFAAAQARYFQRLAARSS